MRVGPFLRSAKSAHHLDGDEEFPPIRVECCTSREEDMAGNWPGNDGSMNNKQSPQSD